MCVFKTLKRGADKSIFEMEKCCTMNCDYNMFTYLATINYERKYMYNADLGCLDHLFIHCSFAQSPWQWIASIIDTLLPYLGFFQML